MDAPNAQSYLQGRVPGAYHFDHYHPEKHRPLVYPACQQTETIVVYRIGRDCEESEFAVACQLDAGIPATRLRLFGGVMEAWKTNGMPIEIGPWDSGELLSTKP